MKKTLVVSGHTDPEHSVANKEIVANLEKLPEVTVDRLGVLYPDFNIDVPAEQAKLISADIVVLQYPVFWYSMPSLLHRWMEDVFQHGFSHGATGDKLRGKALVASITTGAPAQMYGRDAAMGHAIEEYLAPLESTAKLTGMNWGGYVYTGNVSYQTRDDEAALADMKARARDHAERLVKLLETL